MHFQIIYVFRNPKDQAVSWYQFAKMFDMTEKLQEPLGGTWDEFISKYMQGESLLIWCNRRKRICIFLRVGVRPPTEKVKENNNTSGKFKTASKIIVTFIE